MTLTGRMTSVSRKISIIFFTHSCYDDGPRKRSKSYGYKDYGTLVIRRSDRQPKKVFESFNESEIQRSIEKKHQEILELVNFSFFLISFFYVETGILFKKKEG